MSRHRVIYWWSVQFGEGFKAQKQKLRLSLQGEKGNRESELLRDERKQIGVESRGRASVRKECFPKRLRLGMCSAAVSRSRVRRLRLTGLRSKATARSGLQAAGTCEWREGLCLSD